MEGLGREEACGSVWVHRKCFCVRYLNRRKAVARAAERENCGLSGAVSGVVSQGVLDLEGLSPMPRRLGFVTGDPQQIIGNAGRPYEVPKHLYIFCDSMRKENQSGANFLLYDETSSNSLTAPGLPAISPSWEPAALFYSNHSHYVSPHNFASTLCSLVVSLPSGLRSTTLPALSKTWAI